MKHVSLSHIQYSLCAATYQISQA